MEGSLGANDVPQGHAKADLFLYYWAAGKQW